MRSHSAVNDAEHASPTTPGPETPDKDHRTQREPSQTDKNL